MLIDCDRKFAKHCKCSSFPKFPSLCRVTLVGLRFMSIPSIMLIKSFFKSIIHFLEKVVCTIQLFNWSGVICKTITNGCHIVLWLWDQTLTIATRREFALFEPLLSFLANLLITHRILPFMFWYHVFKLYESCIQLWKRETKLLKNIF